MKKWFRRVLLALLVFTGIFALFIVVEHYRGVRLLEKCRQQLIAQGEKLEIEDLIPVRTAGEENGALNLIGAASRLSGGKVVPDHMPLAMKFLLPGKAHVATMNREWRNQYPTSKTEPEIFSVRDLADDIENHRAELEETRTALKATNFNFDVNYRAGFSVLLPHLAKTKRSAQWLRAASLHSLYETNLNGSLENLEALGVLSRTQEHEPLLINHLVAQAIEQIGLNATWEALQTPGWKEGQLTRLQAAWSPQRSLDSLAKSLEMERNMQHKTFEDFRGSSKKMTDLLSSGLLSLLNDEAVSPDSNRLSFFDDEFGQFYKDEVRPLVLRFLYVPLWQVAWSHQEEERDVREIQKIIDAARQTAASNSFAAASSQLTKQVPKTPSAYDRLRFVLPYDPNQWAGSSVLKAVKTETFRSMTVTAIALKRHELRHGKPAAALTDLVPEFLPSVPLDSINGQPLHYRPNADGTFLLYSVGEDGQDDGGDAKPAKAGSSFGNIFTGRDWVWPAPATAEEIQAAESKPKRK